MMDFPRIPDVKVTAVAPMFPGHLRLTWSDGVTRDVDVSASLKGHVMLSMLNIPEVFQDVEVINRGGGIGWANGADFCAQALRITSDEQEANKMKMKA